MKLYIVVPDTFFSVIISLANKNFLLEFIVIRSQIIKYICECSEGLGHLTCAHKNLI